MALKKLKVPHEHKFSCDVDKHVKKQILTNHEPAKWFDDVVKRNNRSRATPSIDLYVAGFPCQPFSAVGMKKGFKDKRGMVFYGCADYIDCKRPRAFILENVKQLINHKRGKTLKKVIQTLEGIGDGTYDVDWKLLDTQDHGVPQSRSRVYIIDVRKNCQRSKISFPEPLEHVSIENFLDPVEREGDSVAVEIRRGESIQNHLVIDHNSSARFCGWMKDKVMSMTKSRARGHWVTTRGRPMNLDETLRCPGMERSFEPVVSDVQLGSQIGNDFAKTSSSGPLSKEYCEEG